MSAGNIGFLGFRTVFNTFLQKTHQKGPAGAIFFHHAVNDGPGSPCTPGTPGGSQHIYTFMWGPGAPTPGTPGGVNTYTELCGARGPRHQGPRRVIHHAVKEGPGSPCTHRTPRGSQDIYRARHGPGKGLPRACQGLAKGWQGREGGGEGEGFLFQKME